MSTGIGPLSLPTSDLNEPLLPTYANTYADRYNGQHKGQDAPAAEPPKEGYAALSVLAKAFWLSVAIVSQIAWGFYGVCCRFLQIQTGVPPLYLTFLITALASISLLSLISVPLSLYQTVKSCRDGRKDDDDGDYGLASEGKPFGITRAKYAIGCGVAYFVLTVTNIGALQLTQAYHVQLVFLALPIFVAILNRVLFKQRAPSGLWSCIFFVFAGVALVVYGGMRGSSADASLSSKDAVGFALAAIAVFSLSMFLILAQSSHGYLKHDQVLWSAFVTQLTVSLFFSKWAEHVDFGILRSFDSSDWTFLLIAGVGVMFGGNWTQQVVVRKIGAPLTSMFCPLQLLASTIGSYLFLNEALTSWFQFGGLSVVAVAITTFLLLQLRAG